MTPFNEVLLCITSEALACATQDGNGHLCRQLSTFDFGIQLLKEGLKNLEFSCQPCSSYMPSSEGFLKTADPSSGPNFPGLTAELKKIPIVSCDLHGILPD